MEQVEALRGRIADWKRLVSEPSSAMPLPEQTHHPLQRAFTAPFAWRYYWYHQYPYTEDFDAIWFRSTEV